MTDDLRLEAVARAYCDARFGASPDDPGTMPPIAAIEARLFCAMFDAAIAFLAQPVTDAEVTAATNAICDRLALRRSNAADTARAALEAAAKVRIGG